MGRGWCVRQVCGKEMVCEASVWEGDGVCEASVLEGDGV